jgi:ATP-dependent helicase STH1/SNF2
MKLYIQIKDHGMVLTEAGVGGRHGGGARGLNNTVMQLRKICNHPYVFDGVEHVINDHLGLQFGHLLSHQEKDMQLGRVAGKFELLDRILPKLLHTGHRVLMFFQMTKIMDIMVDFLEYKNIKSLRLDGGTKHEDRADLLRAFNDPGSDFNIFLLSTRAGGLGLNVCYFQKSLREYNLDLTVL